MRTTYKGRLHEMRLPNDKGGVHGLFARSKECRRERNVFSTGRKGALFEADLIHFFYIIS